MAPTLLRLISRAVLGAAVMFLAVQIVSIAAGDPPAEEPRVTIVPQHGSAMEPAVRDGQAIRVIEFADLSRFDLVVYMRPDSDGAWYLGRIIGLPGERVQVIDGAIYIDDEPLADIVSIVHRYSFGEVRVPAGAFFILADNRNESIDSHSFGPIPADHIIGRAEVLPAGQP